MQVNQLSIDECVKEYMQKASDSVKVKNVTTGEFTFDNLELQSSALTKKGRKIRKLLNENNSNNAEKVMFSD